MKMALVHYFFFFFVVFDSFVATLIVKRTSASIEGEGNGVHQFYFVMAIGRLVSFFIKCASLVSNMICSNLFTSYFFV